MTIVAAQVKSQEVVASRTGHIYENENSQKVAGKECRSH